MQRWFYADEPEKCKRPVFSEDKPPETVDVAVETLTDIWRFSVKVDQPLMKNERVAITGNCDALGNWDPAYTVILDYDPQINRYTKEIEIPRHMDVEYRYAIIAVEENPLYGAPCRRTAVRKWESHHDPRFVRKCQTKLVIKEDVFGEINDEVRIDHGWALTETYIQFKFFRRDLLERPNFSPRPMYIKVVPLFTKKKERHCEHLETTSDEMPSDFQCGDHPSRTFAFSEVLNQAHIDETWKRQPKYGTRCGPEDVILFHLTLGDFENTAYRFEIYSRGKHSHGDEPPFYYGYACLEPDKVKGTEGTAELTVTCASTYRPIDTLPIEYLVITATYGLDTNFETCFGHYWNEKRNGSKIGHRGIGLSYLFDDGLYRENSIYAFERAVENGADMLEMDIMLSRDFIPIAYHDFMLNLALKSIENLREVQEEHDVMAFLKKDFTMKTLHSRGMGLKKCFLALPVANFDYEELKKIQVLRYASDVTIPMECMTNERLALQHPFPALADILDQINCETPFLLEIKWPQMEITGNYEEKFKQWMDKNEFIDAILQVIYKKACKRIIFLACFDLDLCIMLRYKQNLYPVILNYDLDYADKRLADFETAMKYAKLHDFFGLSVRDKIIFDDPQTIITAEFNNLKVFTWGSLSNWQKNRKILEVYGVRGLIYDRLDQKSDNVGIPLKKNVFIYDGIQPSKEVSFILDQEKKKRMKQRLTKGCCPQDPKECFCPSKSRRRRSKNDEEDPDD